MANKDAPKKAKKARGKKKVEKVLQDKVKNTVGRGVMAYFASEESLPPSDTAPTTDVDATLAAMLDEEVKAAGDVHEELKEPLPSTPEGGEAEVPTVTAEPPIEEILQPESEAPPSWERPAPKAPPEASDVSRPAPAENVEEIPVPDVGDITPPRLRPAGTLLEHPMEVEAAPPGPGGEATLELPEPEAPPATLAREEIILRISEEHFKELEKEIGQLYDAVPRVLASHQEAADEALTALHEARALLWGSPERLVDVEYRVGQVKTLLERHKLSAKWASIYGRRLLIYETVWLFLLLGAFVGVQLGQTRLLDWISAVVGSQADTTFVGILVPFLNSLVWGGIGGVVGALYSLWWHVSHLQDFDKRYNMWYLVQPIMGLVLGGIVYLIIATGFLALQGSVPTAEAARGVQMFPSLVAVLGGFRQKFVYELLDRIIRVLTPTPEG